MSSFNEIAFEEALGDLGCMERTQLVLQAISVRGLRGQWLHAAQESVHCAVARAFANCAHTGLLKIALGPALVCKPCALQASASQNYIVATPVASRLPRE